MHRWLRISLKIAGVLVGFFLIIWALLAWYINSHREELLRDINSQLSKEMGGSLQIGAMKPSMLVTFPYFSVSLHNVTLRDSLWQHHHHDLIDAERIYVQLNPLSLLRKKPRIHEVMVRNASIYIFTDSTGYSNKYLLSRHDTTKVGTKKIVFQRLQLQDCKFTMEDKIKHKYFQLNIHNSLGVINYKNSGWDLDLRLNLQVAECQFNTAKGSFLKDKMIRGRLKMTYNYDRHELQIPKQGIMINNDPVDMKGKFSFAESVPLFWLEFDTKRILYRNAASFTSPAIQRRLDSFDLNRPLNMHIWLNGRMKYHDTPAVKVDWVASDNTLSSPIGVMEHCSFNGYYTNQVRPGGEHNDHNSAVVLYKVKGLWAMLPFTADTIQLVDLKQPVLSFHIKADFPIQALNVLTESETFSFDTGRASADIRYKGALNPDDTSRPAIYGDMRIRDAGITYVPRNLSFTKCNATLHFTDSVLYIKDVRVANGQTYLSMQGTVYNFINFYYNNDAHILFDWQINSPMLNLNTFSSFLTRRRQVKGAAGKYRSVNSVARSLDRMLEQSDVHMQAHVNKMVYRRFTATDINANVLLRESDIELSRVDLKNAGGALSLKGAVLEQGNGRHFNLDAHINNVDVSQLFYSFENFGQDAISSENIKGTLSANADLSGSISATGTLIPSSLQGNVKFDMDNGELIHMTPLENIGRYAFKKRNLSDVTFGKLKSELGISSGKILIKPMIIRSSAMNLKIDGVYAPPHGTDINIEMPLRNPKADEINITDVNDESWRQGLIIYLKATSGDDGKVHIGWDRSKGLLKTIKKKKKKWFGG